MNDDELAAWSTRQGRAFRAWQAGERATTEPDPDVEHDRRRERAQLERDRRRVVADQEDA